MIYPGYGTELLFTAAFAFHRYICILEIRRGVTATALSSFLRMLGAIGLTVYTSRCSTWLTSYKRHIQNGCINGMLAISRPCSNPSVASTATPSITAQAAHPVYVPPEKDTILSIDDLNNKGTVKEGEECMNRKSRKQRGRECVISIPITITITIIIFIVETMVARHSPDRPV